jgi:16S rRNA (guanine1207-N2)-methyltransferase
MSHSVMEERGCDNPLALESVRSVENTRVTEHYFSAEPSSPGRARDISFTAGGQDFTLGTAGGVHSASRLDPGTSVLLRKAELPAADTPGPMLDLGCGYGPIAVVLATRAPLAQVWAVDVNSRARELTEANAARLGLADRVRVAEPDAVPDGLLFQQIWSNPPIHPGKTELHQLLLRWLPTLAPGGVAWLVVGKYLGSDSLQSWLVGQGWSVTRHASANGFRVLKVGRPEDL